MSTELNQEIYARFMESGLDRKSFAQRQGISVATLSYHIKRARSAVKAPAVSFTELEVPVAPGHIEISTASGTVVRIPL